MTKKETKKSATVDIFGTDGKKTSEKKLSKNIEKQLNPNLLAQYVRVYLSRQRQGTAMAKNRSAITGSGRKIYRQKGTGRARHGDRQAPIFVGGGVVHGPVPRDYSLKISDKQRKLVFTGVLREKIIEGSVIIVSGLEKLPVKTKSFNTLLNNLGLDKAKSILLIYKNPQDKPAVLSARNIARVEATAEHNVNAYQLLACDKIIMSESADKLLDQFN